MRGCIRPVPPTSLPARAASQASQASSSSHSACSKIQPVTSGPCRREQGLQAGFDGVAEFVVGGEGDPGAAGRRLRAFAGRLPSGWIGAADFFAQLVSSHAPAGELSSRLSNRAKAGEWGGGGLLARGAVSLARAAA
jgi:hypothetical protein